MTTVRDEIANAAFYFGLMSALIEEYGEIDKIMKFDHAKENFVSAAVLEAQGSVLTNKYGEVEPGGGYYVGCEHGDVARSLLAKIVA